MPRWGQVFKLGHYPTTGWWCALKSDFILRHGSCHVASRRRLFELRHNLPHQSRLNDVVSDAAAFRPAVDGPLERRVVDQPLDGRIPRLVDLEVRWSRHSHCDWIA